MFAILILKCTCVKVLAVSVSVGGLRAYSTLSSLGLGFVLWILPGLSSALQSGAVWTLPEVIEAKAALNQLSDFLWQLYKVPLSKLWLCLKSHFLLILDFSEV
jgi:hypothetical protein